MKPEGFTVTWVAYGVHRGRENKGRERDRDEGCFMNIENSRGPTVI